MSGDSLLVLSAVACEQPTADMVEAAANAIAETARYETESEVDT